MDVCIRKGVSTIFDRKTEKHNDQKECELKRNSNEMCVSPLLISNSIKVNRQKKGKIKHIVKNYPVLSASKQWKKKLQSNLPTINEYSFKSDSNSEGDLKNTFENIFTNNSESILSADKIRKENVIEYRVPYRQHFDQNQCNGHTVINSPILKSGKSRLNGPVSNWMSIVGRKTARKKLFSNFNEQRSVISANIEGSVCENEVNSSKLGINRFENVNSGSSKINVHSPAKSTCLKANENYVVARSEQFTNNVNKNSTELQLANKFQFDNCAETQLISPEIKSRKYKYRKSVNLNSNHGVQNVSGNEPHSNDSVDYTIFEYSSPGENSQVVNKSKSCVKIKKTVNFGKLCSIEKEYFENIFQRSDDDPHISDHSSSDEMLTPKKSRQAVNRLDKRHLLISKQFFNNNVISDVNYDSIEKCRNNSFSRIYKRKKISNSSTTTPALEIINKVDNVKNLKILPKRLTDRSSCYDDFKDEQILNKSLKSVSCKEKTSYITTNNVKAKCADSNNSGISCQESLRKASFKDSHKIESISNSFKDGNDDDKSTVKEKLISDVGLINNDSLVITNNSSNCSHASMDFVIDTISSPSLPTSNKTVDEIQFSDASSLDKECIIPRNIVCNSVNVEDVQFVLDSASKSRRKKYAENSLAARIVTIKNRYESDARLKQYMLNSSDYLQVKLPVFYVNSVWKEYGRSIISCCPYDKDQLCDCSIGSSDLKAASLDNKRRCDNNLYVLMNFGTERTEVVTSGSLIRIHQPWNVLQVSDCTIVFGITCLEIVSHQLKRPANENRSTSVTKFDCLCSKDLVKNVNCRLRLYDHQIIETISGQARNSEDIGKGMRRKIIPSLFFYKQSEGTLSSFRAFHLLNPEAYITVEILSTIDFRNKNEKMCAVIRDEIEEIGAVVLSTETDLIKWREVTTAPNEQLAGKYYKIKGVKIIERDLVNNCQILEGCQLSCTTNQRHFCYFAPISDWWIIHALNDSDLVRLDKQD